LGLKEFLEQLALKDLKEALDHKELPERPVQQDLLGRPGKAAPDPLVPQDYRELLDL
jgi:hypothetical protein